METKPALKRGQRDPLWVRWTLISLAIAILTVLVILPVLNVFAQALADGPGVYWDALVLDEDTRHAIFLTLAIAPAAVVCNTLFGIAAAWLFARYSFRGRTLLVTLIDLPFSVSPVVAGLVFVLWFGLHGYAGAFLLRHNIQILFAWPGILLATIFVTFPFVVRELLPLMEEIGPDEELAALTLGANRWQIFWNVTLPNIKWGLLYGILLCNARALGEFGAVSVVSGHIRGLTNTMPLHVEILYNEYNFVGAFAVAKQTFKHAARIDFDGQRRRRAAPRDCIRVSASITRVARACELVGLQPQFQRSQLRVLPQRARRDLIGGDACLNVDAFGLFRMHAGQPRRARARVIARAIAQRAA
mgnify:CR=1 FL=1